MALDHIPFPTNHVKLEGFAQTVNLTGNGLRLSGNSLTARNSTFTTELQVGRRIRGYKALTGSSFQVVISGSDGHLQAIGSSFNTELFPGDKVLINGIEVEVVSITSNTDVLLTVAQTIVVQVSAERQIFDTVITEITNDYLALTESFLTDSNLVIPASNLRIAVDANNGVFEIIARNKDAIVIRNPIAVAITQQTSDTVRVERYANYTSQLQLEPAPQTTALFEVHYIPKLKELVLDTDNLEIPSEWEEAVIQYAVCEVLKIEETDTTQQMQTLMAQLDSIRANATTRMADASKKPIEIESDYATVMSPLVGDYNPY